MRKLRQSQDKPQNKARMKLKKARVIDLCVKQGKTVRQASMILKAEGFEKGVSRTRVGVALQEIAREVPAKVEAARQEASEQLRALRDAITKARKLGLKDQVNLLLQVHDRYARLLGLEAPTKSITTNIGGNLTPEYIEIAKAMADVAPEDRHKVLDYIRSLVKPVTLDSSCYPPEAK